MVASQVKTFNMFYLIIYWTQKVHNDFIFLYGIILPPVSHSSNHEYHYWNLRDNRAVVQIFFFIWYRTATCQPLVKPWVSLLKLTRQWSCSWNYCHLSNHEYHFWNKSIELWFELLSHFLGFFSWLSLVYEFYQKERNYVYEKSLFGSDIWYKLMNMYHTSNSNKKNLWEPENCIHWNISLVLIKWPL